jgi:hypothetical protein
MVYILSNAKWGQEIYSTVRGFNQSAAGDFCREAEKSHEKFGSASTDSSYENVREITIGLLE